MLSDKEGLIFKKIEVLREFNIHFQSITSSLGLFKQPDLSESLNKPDPIKSIVNKYKKHHSIKKIKGKYIIINPFTLPPVIPKDVLDVISTLDNTKPSGREIFSRTLKDNKIFRRVLHKWINNSLKTSNFSDSLKFEEITFALKKEDPFDKENYWPISVLSLILKLFEKIIYSQVYNYIQQ